MNITQKPRTILVLGQHPGLAEAVRAAVDAATVRVIHRTDTVEATPLLAPGMIDACILDAGTTEIYGLWNIEKIRRQIPNCPILVFTETQPWPFEEEAYLHGVAHVFPKPLRARMFCAVLDKLWDIEPAPAARPAAPARPLPPAVPAPAPALASAVAASQPAEWQVLKNFSSVLAHSLSADALIRQFMQMLREMLGVNRAAVFLRQPSLNLAGMPGSANKEALRGACAQGLAPGLLDHFQLSLESGIGGYIFRTGRILRQEAVEAQHDPEMVKEFEVLGAQVAIPVLDRESLLGVALFDRHLTGEPITNEELEFIFHLFEELGVTIKNIWLHEQLVANHEIVSEILQQLSGACVVVGPDLTIAHANKKARLLFSRGGQRGGDFDFSELPPALASKVYLALKNGSGFAPFQFTPPDKPEKLFNVSILPFQKSGALTPPSVLLVAEDLTQSEQLQKLEAEAAQLRLLKTISARLAHEIGNTLVPISVHQQLLSKKIDDPEFRASLNQALADGTRRIMRFVSQMKYLAKDDLQSEESISLEALLEDAVQEAQHHHPVAAKSVFINKPPVPLMVTGDRPALKGALAEVILNAMQANPDVPQVDVKLRFDAGSNGTPWVHIEVQDAGEGFAPEVVKKAAEPFFTTRAVGLGLGLTVCQRIIQSHRGKLEIPPAKQPNHGLVKISLPATPA